MHAHMHRRTHTTMKRVDTEVDQVSLHCNLWLMLHSIVRYSTLLY